MKLSMLLFKKSPYFSPSILVCFSMICCRGDNRGGIEFLIYPPVHIDTAIKTPKGLFNLGKLTASSCGARPQGTWKIQFDSPFGTHEVVVPVIPDPKKRNVRVFIDNKPYRALTALPMGISPLSEGCQLQKQSSPTALVLPDSVKEDTIILLKSLAPSCAFSVGKNGWECELDKLDPKKAVIQLSAQRRKIIYRWNRRPYILTRRLTITSQLAKLLAKPANNRDLHAICKIIEFSIPEELPLIMRNQTWRKAACETPSYEDNQKALLYGLALAVKEVNTLSQKFEQSSKTGSLTIKIPKNEAPARDLWVSISPLQNPMQSPVNRHQSCWHPLLAANSNQDFQLAAELLDLPMVDKYACSTKLDIAINKVTAEDIFLEKYVNQSISSETEFPITNGRTKILRLPKGEYSYQLKRHVTPSTKPIENYTFESSKGKIDWIKNRPRLLIRKF